MLAAARASDKRLQLLAQRVAATGGYQLPTLALFESIVSLDTPIETLARASEMRFVPDAAIKQWTNQREQLKSSGLTVEQTEAFRDVRRRIVRAYAKAGVPIMAGSDTAQAFHIWGPGLIDEIEALVAAGLSRMDALRSATVVPRNYLRSLPNGGSNRGWTPNFGTITEGARADIILLKEDPSQNIEALRNIEMVIASGELYDRFALDAMIDKAAVDAKAVQTTATAQTDKHVYVMRHLDTDDGQDPSLNANGSNRAKQLSNFLSDRDIQEIFVTDTRRSRETVLPLASKLGIKPTLYDPRRPDILASLVGGIAGTVLVIGHSNTVPDLITRLGGKPPQSIARSVFGTIWRIDANSGQTRNFSLDGPAPAQLSACLEQKPNPSARCDSIPIQANRTRSSRRMLDIHFAVIPASRTATDAPPVILAGAPGLGGVHA